MEGLSLIFTIFKNWWWVFVPILLFFPFKSLYLWWLRWDVWYPRFKWILLEVKPPKEILKPFKAMEDVFSVLWGIIDAPNWREKWCEGEIPLGGGLWLSFEIVSIGGEIHFFIRMPDFFRDTAESAIYGQYPEAEISVVPDYTKNVPEDIPNKEWDLYGENISLLRQDFYPIKTYPQFFEEKVAIPEEKRIDPMDSLLEALSRLQPGEQLWIQIVANPIFDAILPWTGKGKAEIKKIGSAVSKRWFGEEKKPSIWDILIGGKTAPSAPPPAKPWPPGELMPKEQEIIAGIENKIKKHAYQTWIRALYIYKRNEPHFFGNYKIPRTYFNHFMTEHLNSPVYWGPTRTRIHYWFRDRRIYLRKRKQFKGYVDRLPPLWPRTMTGEPLFSFGFAPRGPGIRGTVILNIEELATIFHFPAKIITPALPYVEAKKGGPPPRLPVK